MNKIQMAEQLRRALQMFVQTVSDEEALEVAGVYPEWKAGVKYKEGQRVVYGVNNVGDPQLYKCNAPGHTSQEDWTPDIAVSLWTAVGVAGDGIDVWAQPAGAHDAYDEGDLVHYPDKDGPVYRSKYNGNVYSPDVWPDGWELV